MRKHRFVAIITALALVIAAPGAPAQRLAPVAVATHSSAAPTHAEQDALANARGARRQHATTGAMIGAGVGTVLGLGLAAIAPTDGTGRSDKRMLFVGLGLLGAFGGSVIGATIGAVIP